MREWFERIFGAVAEAFGNAVSDIRSKLVEEGVWGRKVPEHSDRHGSQLSPDRGDVDHHGGGLLDRLFGTHPESFSPDKEPADHDVDRGIDR